MEEEKEFQIRDRRVHLEAGAEPNGAEKTSGDKAARETNAQAAPREEKQAPEEPHGAFPVDFASFVLSLATSALIHLGEEAGPATGTRSIHLPMAQQVIDLIALLEDKTQGNLTKDEETLLSQLLYTLRMKYVEIEKKRRS